MVRRSASESTPLELADRREAVTTPLRFAELVADPMASPQQLLDAILDEGVASSTAWPRHPLLDPWRAVLAPLVVLEGRQDYIGTFRVVIDRAAAASKDLSRRDRQAAALLLLERTAATATTRADFRRGVLAAQRVDPVFLADAELLPVVVRTCLSSRPSDGVVDAVLVGLPATLELLAEAKRRCIHAQHVWALRAGLARFPRSELDALQPVISALHPQDRKVVRTLLDPPRARRWPVRLHR